ncbi:MAG: imidazolonepropionase [Flavobacteriaceae bacterium]|nr:imidazolonepropionase [Flavobacteriaceae bacterium]
MTQLFTNIKELIQVRETPISFISGTAMSELPTLKNTFLLIENESIIDYGSMANVPKQADEIIDCSGRMILPTWVDSHTHIVFAGNREQEFVDRINGLSYEEIANKGGGILNSAKKLQNTSFDDLYKASAKRLEAVIKLGTGAIEIKSGYGLTVESELKMLKVIKKLKENYTIPIKATFLGAHAVPSEFKNNKKGYIDLIINEMLPKIADENLADFVDVFCEKGYFTVEDTDQILKAAKNYGLQPKIHVNQFNAIGGIKTAVAHKALSVDHLEVLTHEDITHIKSSETMPVALPSCSFFLGIPYTPARKIIDANLPIALATDYNPGSTPSGNMNFVVSLACIKLKMKPEEAINAATINAAYAVNLSDKVGSISRGKLANFFITKPISSYNFLPYSFGENLIESIYISGSKV